MMTILFSTAYFAPVNYYTSYLQSSVRFLDIHENFIKQTYRNRCVILGGNGPVPLVVPVVKGRGKKIMIRDLEISYDMDWQRNHWRTIFSAYNSSPYFEFYKDDLLPVFQKRTKYLVDLNLMAHSIICDLLELEGNFQTTEEFEEVPRSTLNMRESFSPKNKSENNSFFHPVKYTQVFSDRYQFISNLSILDLLFNEGPNSSSLLEQGWRK